LNSGLFFLKKLPWAILGGRVCPICGTPKESETTKFTLRLRQLRKATKNMTYLSERFLQKPILRSRLLKLALISLVLIALHATPARAQCVPAGVCWTDTGNDIHNTNTGGKVGIGTASPAAQLHITQALRIDGTDIGGGYRAITFGGPYPAYPNIYSNGSSSGYLVLNGPGALYLNWDAGGGTKTLIQANGGNVGIGTATPNSNYKLDVNGNTNVTGSINVTGNINAKFQDVAEWVPSTQKLPTGTVVVLDSTKSNHVIASTKGYDTRVAGVISARPGIALGEGGDSKVLVATTGRVRVKVDATRSPIHVGDLLVTSDVPGLAMKSEPVNIGGVQLHRPGTLIGKALEPLSKGSGTILVLLSLQ
jgi:hypothetical protein